MKAPGIPNLPQELMIPEGKGLVYLVSNLYFAQFAGGDLWCIQGKVPQRSIITASTRIDDDTVYMNYFLPVFSKTIRKGKIELFPYNERTYFVCCGRYGDKWHLKECLVIVVSIEFFAQYVFPHRQKFISCLFNIPVECVQPFV